MTLVDDLPETQLCTHMTHIPDIHVIHVHFLGVFFPKSECVAFDKDPSCSSQDMTASLCSNQKPAWACQKVSRCDAQQSTPQHHVVQLRPGSDVCSDLQKAKYHLFLIDHIDTFYLLASTTKFIQIRGDKLVDVLAHPLPPPYPHQLFHRHLLPRLLSCVSLS